MLYGIEMEDDDMEELGLLAWNLIGNKNTQGHGAALYSSNYGLIEINGGSIIKVGLRIPSGSDNFATFCTLMNKYENDCGI